MNINTRILLIKYGKLEGICDCIREHQEVIKEKGYCWFGKIGRSPSVSCIEKKMGQGNKILLLYSQGHVHECICTEIVTEKPDDGYPSYYDKCFFRVGLEPSVYFKLISIEEFPYQEFLKCASLSSKRQLSDTVHRSMASLFYGIYLGHVVILERPEANEEKKIAEGVKKQKNSEIRDNNSCKFRKNGICFCKSSINFEYECERPANCIKQKPLIMGT